jgi:DNA repair protein RecN (Recombination protein N)
MNDQIAVLEETLRDTGRRLTAARQAAAKKLIPLVQKQLADLGMKEAEFQVEFVNLAGVIDDPAKPARPRGRSAPAPLSEALSLRDFSTASGLETVEFMIAPNPGQPARPLRRIASGGELSRVMLGLKSILAQADRVSVLVFDEIDANVGGRMGSIIGAKLRALARVHQVLCITHLPQIASFGDRHLTIRKQTTAGESYTTVTVMQGDHRVRELAEMITGKDVTDISLAQARELLELGAPPPEANITPKTKRAPPK